MERSKVKKEIEGTEKHSGYFGERLASDMCKGHHHKKKGY